MVNQLSKITHFAARLQDYPGHPPKLLEPCECIIVDNIIQEISNIDNNMTPKIEKSQNLRAHLEIIQGNFPSVKHEYRFPDPYPDKATAVLEKFEAINWGAPDEVEETPPATPTTPTDATNRSLARAPRSPTRKSPLTIPRADHRIFGIDGIMRGILISSVGMRTYCIDSRFPPRRSTVVGHNGLSIGDWWPMQICALRDGAHGARISGIAGGKSNGAFSIVVSGQYEGLDADRGNALFYSGSQALENRDPDVPIISMYTEAMRLALQLRRSLRVLRCSRSSSRYSPSKGIRYDGLYTIAGEETKQNAHGGAYIRFQLVRDSNQPDIDLTRPNAEERRLCEQVRRGY